MQCPLCLSERTEFFCHDTYREYYHCLCCGLVFVPKRHFLSAADEKTIYDQHENKPEDQAYRQFLNRLFEPLQSLLAPKSNGLDFGCGPGPTLSCMLADQGHHVELYDCYYYPNKKNLKGQYDFITATEVLEHLYHPHDELNRLWRCLKPGGYFGVMTQFCTDNVLFKDWYYKNDPTHVCFYAQSTFVWLADYWQADVKFYHNTAIFLKA